MTSQQALSKLRTADKALECAGEDHDVLWIAKRQAQENLWKAQAEYACATLDFQSATERYESATEAFELAAGEVARAA